MAARKFPELMTPRETSQAFRVDPSTITRWARTGRLRSFRTPGGDHRFYRAQVEAMIAGQPLTEAQLDALVRGDL
jgi:excisionase family DNA binding protein